MRKNHLRTIKTLAENRSEKMTRKVDKNDYQDVADCIRMEQVSAPEIAELFTDKSFYKWYKKKYL